MNIESLTKLYVHELKDLYSAENQILDELPSLIEKASVSELKKSLENHRRETERQVDRITRIFRSLDFEPGGHKCKGMEGLLKEGRSLLQDVSDDDVLDVAIVSACERVEHYEIAGYGITISLAELLGRDEDARILRETLDEERAASEKLSGLTERCARPAVAGA